MHYDLTITVPGDIEDARRMIASMVDRHLVPGGRARYATDNGRVRIRWDRINVDRGEAPSEATLTHALADLAALAGRDAPDAVPHIQLDVDESRHLTQADFDPAEDL